MDGTLTDMPMHYAGGGFPWGLLIIGGIIYFLWSKGVFGRFGNGHRYGGGYGPGYGTGQGPAQAPDGPGYGPGAGAGQGSTPGFGGPRAMFDDWHRQAHETAGTPPQTQAPIAPTAPAAPAAATEASTSGNGESTGSSSA